MSAPNTGFVPQGGLPATTSPAGGSPDGSSAAAAMAMAAPQAPQPMTSAQFQQGQFNVQGQPQSGHQAQMPQFYQQYAQQQPVQQGFVPQPQPGQQPQFAQAPQLGPQSQVAGAPAYVQPGQFPIPGQYAPPQAPAQQPQFAPPIGVMQPQGQPQNQFRIAAGPGIPPEFVGRTLGEIARMYGQPAQQVLQQPQAAAQLSPNPQQTQVQQGLPAPQPQQPQLQPPQQRLPNMQQAQFWQNPQENIGQIVQQSIQQAVQQIQGPQVIEQNIARISNRPGYAQLVPVIAQQLNGLTTQDMMDPRAFEIAYDIAFSQAVRSGQLSPNGQPVQQQVQQPQAQPSFNQLNSGQQYAPAVNQFFTEQPGNGVPAGSNVLSPMELAMAQKQGMSPQQYAQWKSMIPADGGGFR